MNPARPGVLQAWAPGMRLLLDAFLLLVFAGMMWQSREWPSLVKVIPMTVGAIGAILSTSQLVADALSILRPSHHTVEEPNRALADDVGEDDAEDPLTLRAMGVSLAAMLMFLGLIVLFGFAIGGAVASVVYLAGFRRQNLVAVLVVTVALYLVVAFGFEDLLQVSLPEGVLLPMS